MEIALTLLAALAIIFVNRRWFWVIALGLGSLVSFFAMIASVVHFQILGAVGFFILMAVLVSLSVMLSERGNNPEKSGSGQELN